MILGNGIKEEIKLHGIFISDRRPNNKAEIKRMIQSYPENVYLEALSDYCGTDFDGCVTEMPNGRKISFVAPTEDSEHRFYGSITRKGNSFRVE